MWVELSSLITGSNVDLGQVTETLDLPVQRGFDKVDCGESSVGNDSSVVSGFYSVNKSVIDDTMLLTDTPSDLLLLSVTDDRVGLWRSEKTAKGSVSGLYALRSKHVQVVDAVEGDESSHRGLVDGSTHGGLGRVYESDEALIMQSLVM